MIHYGQLNVQSCPVVPLHECWYSNEAKSYCRNNNNKIKPNLMGGKF
jgi:hypothetical protein